MPVPFNTGGGGGENGGGGGKELKGTLIAKYFVNPETRKEEPFKGIVNNFIEKDENGNICNYYQIIYQDNDQEEVDINELIYMKKLYQKLFGKKKKKKNNNVFIKHTKLDYKGDEVTDDDDEGEEGEGDDNDDDDENDDNDENDNYDDNDDNEIT